MSNLLQRTIDISRGKTKRSTVLAREKAAEEERVKNIQLLPDVEALQRFVLVLVLSRVSSSQFQRPLSGISISCLSDGKSLPNRRAGNKCLYKTHFLAS